MIRSFIAVEIPATVRRSITRLIRDTIGFGYPVRWTKEDNLHLTLKFLGDITETQVGEISSALSILADATPRFPFSLKGLGGFPSSRAARIVWVGAETGRENVTTLQRSLETELSPLGFKPESREFSPHLTIGRIRSPLDVIAIAATPFESEVFDIKSLVLFKSTLYPAGPIYDSLGEFLLAGG